MSPANAVRVKVLRVGTTEFKTRVASESMKKESNISRISDCGPKRVWIT
ncbi:MAG: hypothetical protein CM15mP89_4440 [Gammaproteobacteria bacterium]|nr:MAG: hypothetical protein CM15mP89_4440 [Gammaproteobacteria bacterium]